MAGGIHPSGSSRAERDVQQTRFCARSPTPRRPVTGCRPRHPRRVGTASADPARLSLAAVMGPGRFHAGDVDTDGELVARVPDSTIPPGHVPPTTRGDLRRDYQQPDPRRPDTSPTRRTQPPDQRRSESRPRNGVTPASSSALGARQRSLRHTTRAAHRLPKASRRVRRA
jgi:hypothetical protein